MLSDVDTFVMLGASITAAMVGTRDAAWESYVLEKTGKTVTVVNEGVGGNTIALMDARLGALLTTYAAGGANVMFCLHGLANNPLSLFPYSGMTAQAQSDLYDEYAAFVQRIIDNGNRVDIATSTFIDDNTDGSCVADESLGTKPFNDNIVIPLAAIHNEPELFDSVNNVPVSDMYTFTYNNYTQSGLGDGIHYTPAGYEALAHFRLSRLVDSIYNGVISQPVPKLGDSRVDFSPAPSRFVIDCASTGTYRPSPNSIGITVASTALLSDEEVYPADPRLSPITYSQPATAGASAAYTVAANSSLSIYNSDLLSSIHYTTTVGGAKTITLKNLGAGSRWIVRWACSSDLALSIGTDITIGAKSFTALAKDSGVQETTVDIDGTGNIDIVYSANAGFGYGVLNGLEFIPSVPPSYRASVGKIAYHLRNLAMYSSKQTNAIVMDWLLNEGMDRGQINEMLYLYLGEQGYTGAMNDRLKQWGNDV